MAALRSLRLTSLSSRSFSTTPRTSLAKMQLIGRLADTPAATPTSTGRDVIRYSLGVSSGSRDESGNRKVSWFNVASFSEGPQRDLLLSLPKGTLLYVEAEAKMDTFQTQDGSNRTALNLLQRNFESLSRPKVDNLEGEGAGSAVEEPQSGLGAS
ncbi:hypothetical protein B0A48_09631 [Cryoendolithus antarcticus]|uniref:Single-stranded DNA-binding protein RIM1, mitochondrial n=1 Tax=Cryoendolithus antarcticus TaxID=1507870 RepID=A0A1V8T0G3_9PEZI|nr:hypothetical protein B0A48_09631 [Cryoendolithus antarcticus]